VLSAISCRAGLLYLPVNVQCDGCRLYVRLSTFVINFQGQVQWEIAPTYLSSRALPRCVPPGRRRSHLRCGAGTSSARSAKYRGRSRPSGWFIRAGREQLGAPSRKGRRRPRREGRRGSHLVAPLVRRSRCCGLQLRFVAPPGDFGRTESCPFLFTRGKCRVDCPCLSALRSEF
jgi:hypothetical protein